VFGRHGLGLLAAALVIAGCGGGSGASRADVAAVKQVMARAFAALANGDGETVCSLATQSGQQKIVPDLSKIQASVPGATCPSVIREATRLLPPQIKEGMRSVVIKKVTMNGNDATVQDADIGSTRGTLMGFLHPGGEPTTLMKQSDGSWKISS
jgi:hypothetical protein